MIFSIELTTLWRGALTLPFLSRVGFKGQLKSPPIIMFFFQCHIHCVFELDRVKKFDCLIISVRTVNINQNIPFILISAFNIINLPSESLLQFRILISSPRSNKTATPLTSLDSYENL